MRRSRLLVIALVASCFGSAACSAILGLEPPPAEDAGPTEAGTDSTASDGTAADSPGPQPDSGTDGGADVGTDAPVCAPLVAGDAGDAGDAATFYSLKDNWDFYEPNIVNALSHDFQGGVFDGRYVYFVPNGSGTVTRYDTHGSFTSGSSWSTFDTTMLSPSAEDFAGAVYDGRYVYFVPEGGGVIARHDTQGSFLQSSGWSVFDLTSLPVADAGSLVGFNGGVFDGQGVYFVPDYDGVDRLSRVVRYQVVPEAGAPDSGSPDAGGPDGGADAGDAQPPPFATDSQFQVFDLTLRNSSAEGYIGGAFDGHYVYFVPYYNVVGNSGIVARYNPGDSFVSTGSWSTLDLSALSPNAVGFVGAAFDGRYVYLAPHQKTLVARFDTQAAFADSAWTTFDVSQILATDAGLAGFQGAAFDGRFVYFVPGNVNGQGVGQVVRYDTLSTFGAACAWSSFDISTLNASATNYFGAVYDGQYLYLAPKGTWVARFETKSTSAMPQLPAFNGSFY